MAPTPQTTSPFGWSSNRRWLTIEQLSRRHPAYTPPALRALKRGSRRHFDHRGELVEGNGLAHAFCQPGGKSGKVMVDEIAFVRWLEQWVGEAACNPDREERDNPVTEDASGVNPRARQTATPETASQNACGENGGQPIRAAQPGYRLKAMGAARQTRGANRTQCV